MYVFFPQHYICEIHPCSHSLCILIATYYSVPFHKYPTLYPILYPLSCKDHLSCSQFEAIMNSTILFPASLQALAWVDSVFLSFFHSLHYLRPWPFYKILVSIAHPFCESFVDHSSIPNYSLSGHLTLQPMS